MKKPGFAALLLAVVMLFSIAGCAKSGGNKDAKDDGTRTITTEPGSIPINDPNDDPELQTESTTAAITTTAAPVTAAPAPQTTTAASGWQNAPANVLYRPAASQFVDQYTAYAYCTDTAVQNYVKMRLGPSKSQFNVTGTQLPNNTPVTVQSVSVNGWTLCYYQGVEGWIRSDFLFGAPVSDAATAAPPAGETVCGGPYLVNVTGEYAGEPLNMRSGPGRENALITTVNNMEIVYVADNTPIQNGWIKVTYGNDTGYVLYKYLEHAGDAGDKPVLYLYPEKETDVDVKLTLAEDIFFSCTYPAYKNGWKVTAAPDGTLTDRADGKQYSCLYWELCGNADYTFDEGFVVKGSDTAAFLEKTLSEIGLSPRERNEFIIYWLPRMQNNAWNLISFQKETYTSVVQLDISPAPDSLLRVFMAYKPMDAPVQIRPQRFDPFNRTGFTAVEWGGVEVE